MASYRRWLLNHILKKRSLTLSNISNCTADRIILIMFLNKWGRGLSRGVVIELDGQRSRVRPSMPCSLWVSNQYRRKLFVGGIHWNTTDGTTMVVMVICGLTGLL
jgi:hypothetical protein